MNNVFSRAACLTAMLAGLLAAEAAAADPMTTVPKTNWSQYVAVNTITAEVMKVDGDSVTMRVYWMAPGGTNGKGNGNSGNRRPSLSGNHGRSSSNPLQRMTQQGRSSRPQMHQEHHDYDVAYFPDTTVRGRVATTKDADGKSEPVSPNSLTPGMVVQTALIRDKSIALKDLKDTDLKAKAIIVLGTNPNHKDDSSSPGNNNNKKK